MLAAAREGRYAIVAFNPVDYASMRAAVEAAEAERAPVILQTSAKTVKYHGHEALASWARRLGDQATVPVALHLDHGKDLDLIRRCIESGWTAVMIDASDKPFDENLALTRQVLDLATPKNVGVEAEIGEIGGVEEDIAVEGEAAHLCDPDKAAAFCEALPELAVFAPACGTAHGYYHGEPKVAFDLLAVCSTSAEDSVRAVLTAGLGVERVARFAAIFAGDIVPRKKPAPDIYLLAAQRLALNPARTVVVEDTRVGLLAAKAAGINCVVTPSPYTRGEDFTGADLIVEDLEAGGVTLETLRRLTSS